MRLYISTCSVVCDVCMASVLQTLLESLSKSTSGSRSMPEHSSLVICLKAHSIIHDLHMYFGSGIVDRCWLGAISKWYHKH